MKLTQSLGSFWDALPAKCKVVCPAQESVRFPELTYLREDQIGNYKGRKYASLIPWMKERGYKHVLLRGSSHSSNILQLSLALRRANISASYELEGREGPAVGNGLLSRLVLGQQFLDSENRVTPDWVVPEGGSCPASLAGSLGIAGSLIHHVLQRDELPEDIYIDSGTGFTAAALILGLGFFELPCRVRVVSMTRQEKKDLKDLLESLTPEYERLLGKTPNSVSFEVSQPPVGRSFGSTPSSVFQEIEEIAQQESLLVDPLYTAKLSLAYKQHRDPLRKAMMFISGGQAELLGFQKPLANWLGR